MAKHIMRIDLDADGNVTVTHRCVVTVAGHEVGHSEAVELDDPGAIAGPLARLVEANRAEMEARTTALALQHVAAVEGKNQKGAKTQRLGGTVGSVGGVEPKRG